MYGALLMFSAGCSPLPRFATGERPDRSQLVESQPDIEQRNLFHGVGGPALAPPAQAPFRFVEKDTSGFNDNYDLVDANGRAWDAKPGPEAQPEVVASRLLWAIGFHQPPVYYVKAWTMEGGPDAGAMPPARFRLEQPGWKKKGTWDWQRNPFVGTRELDGLVVMMALLGNWDVKASNNQIYEVGEGRRIYVVKDLGSSLGRSVSRFLGTRGDLAGFESERLVREVRGERVVLDFDELMLSWGLDRGVSVDDVLWTCRRLDRLSDRQWRDAFRAAGYEGEVAERFVQHFRAKVREGLVLRQAVTRRNGA